MAGAIGSARTRNCRASGAPRSHRGESKPCNGLHCAIPIVSLNEPRITPLAIFCSSSAREGLLEHRL